MRTVGILTYYNVVSPTNLYLLGFIGVMNPVHASDIEDPKTLESISKDDSKQTYLGNYFYITVPWSIEYYFTVRGSENFHIYLWVAKDLAWTQDAYWPSMIFGSMALAWCGVLAFNAIRHRSIDEVYMLIALTMWLAANFVWMAGIYDVHVLCLCLIS